MESVLVTGGAGFLGAVLCKRLLSAGYRVRCVDAFHYGTESISRFDAHPHLEIFARDLLESPPTEEMLRGVCAVIHLAGPADDASFDLDPVRGMQLSVEGSGSLARLALRMGVRRFLFASSCAVYGRGASLSLTEDSSLHPLTAYARAKANAETALRELRGEGLEPVLLRAATLFGVSPRMRFDLAVNRMSMEARTRGRICIHGEGEQWRPFVHVDDAARAMLAALRAPAERVSGQIFNVGSDEQNYRIRELADLVRHVLPGIELESVPARADERSYHVAFNKLRAELDWSPNFSVRDGIQEVIRSIEQGEYPHPEHPRYHNARMEQANALMEQAQSDRPALEGGIATRDRFLPFALPMLGEEEEREVLAVLRSGWITTGERCKKFEADLRDYTGARGLVCVNSCTAALHLALLAAGIGPGDEVITSPVTWPSTANVIVHCGATPVFADVERDTLNIDPARIAERITPRTRAILPVHMAGLPARLAEIHALAERHGLHVIEDAAHALGAEYRGARIGSLSRFTCFSFYPIKNITTGEGGAIALGNLEDEERVRRLALHGITRDAWQRYTDKGTPHWECVEPGFKYNMPDLTAALGIPQLRKLEGFIATRRAHAQRYREQLASLPEVSLLAGECADTRHAHHLFIVRLELERLRVDRDTFLRALQAEGIGVGIHFRSLHLQPYYRDRFAFAPQAFPHALFNSERILSLPLYPRMSEADVSAVARAMKKLLRYYRR